MKIPEEQFYEIAGREVKENEVRLGLWTMAFSESPGDEQQAKALYIKLRVAQLKDEHKEAERRRDAEAKGAAQSGSIDIEGFIFVEKNEQGYDEYTHDASGIRFVHLPGGEFEMGSPDTEVGRLSDEAKHTVKLSPFLIAKYEVTQAAYATVMKDPPAFLSATPAYFGGENRPVEQVSWNDLKHPDGFLGRTGFSLPSEAQWEYACRAGTTSAFAGNGILDDMGW